MTDQVQTSARFPKLRDRVRPYDLWSVTKRKAYRYRHYAIRDNAHWGALKELRWADPGEAIEVVDSSKGKLIAQYVRGLDDLKFFDGKNLLSLPDMDVLTKQIRALDNGGKL